MLIEKYSEELSKYRHLVHEACEGRYELTGYDLCVIEAALDQFQDTGDSYSDYRHSMTYDQPCQIDCMVTSCKFYKGAGKCENSSPAITLNENGKFVCWSKDNC